MRMGVGSGEIWEGGAAGEEWGRVQQPIGAGVGIPEPIRGRDGWDQSCRVVGNRRGPRAEAVEESGSEGDSGREEKDGMRGGRIPWCFPDFRGGRGAQVLAQMGGAGGGR